MKLELDVSPKAVGMRVRTYRRRLGLTQAVLAQLAGFSQRWLLQVEAGEVDLRLSAAAELARVLRIELEDLIRTPASTNVPQSRLGRLTPRQASRVERGSTRWGTLIGDIWFPWVVASFGPYQPENIESHYHPDEPVYPVDVEEAFQGVCADIAHRQRVGEEVPYDSENFKLLRFHVSHRVGRREEPRLVLHFGPTTYFRMLATDQRLDVPITSGGRTSTLRERYGAGIDLRSAPILELATQWGVGLSVVTAEGYLLISERGNTAVDPHVFFPAVAETSIRSVDDSPGEGLNHFKTAARGVGEELGIELEPKELTWLSFGANSYLCEYGLIGRVDTRYTLDDINRRRGLGAAKDSWETRQLHAVEFNPGAVVEFCCRRDRRFSPFALIAIIHTLMHEYGVGRTEAAFERARIAVSQHLPSWLEAGEEGGVN